MCGWKLTSVASNLLTKSGRAMLAALLAGESDPQALAELAKGRLRSKIPALREEFWHNVTVPGSLPNPPPLIDRKSTWRRPLNARLTG